MAEDFHKYLAVEIVSEKRTLSYRTVARALKVHVNAAKCMLHDFYEHENAKKPGSIYATFLVAGTKKGSRNPVRTNGNDAPTEDDSPPPSSPPPFTSSMLDPSQDEKNEDMEDRNTVPVRTITLVREESLEAMKEQYEILTSIHLYSLSPARITDLVTLTDIGRGLFSDVFVKEDPLVHNHTYGVIQNPDVRRRKGKRPAVVETTALKTNVLNEEIRIAPKPAPLKKESSRPGSSGSIASTTSTNKPATLKRDASDIFKSFAKAKSKPQNDSQDTASAAEDVKMADEEGESEDEALFLDTNTRQPASKKRPSDVKKERDDKATKLRKMMDSDDESILAAPAAAPAKDVENVEQGEEVAWSDSDTEQISKPAAAESEPEAVADPQPPKRRRAKRKITKKRTMKDEDGYLVTKEEVAWESYSEDEPVLAAKARVKVEVKSSGKLGKAKTGGTGGAGIMSFFGKK